MLEGVQIHILLKMIEMIEMIEMNEIQSSIKEKCGVGCSIVNSLCKQFKFIDTLFKQECTMVVGQVWYRLVSPT